jgi:formylglycine-generating enzyme required for sulfatase activity
MLRLLVIIICLSLAGAFAMADDGAPMVLVPAGEFTMGSGGKAIDEDREEAPPHQLTLPAFQIDKQEVTTALFCRFLNETGQTECGQGFPFLGLPQYLPIQQVGGQWAPLPGKEQFPMTNVTWHGATIYAKWAGKRLPTEAEWEKAARGGLSHQRYPWGQELAIEAANYEDAVGKTTAVGTYPANGYGLVDMAGNVWEWCADWYEDGYYAKSPDADPQGPQKGSERILRGGCWHREAASLRCSNHYHNAPKNVVNSVGFRCARTL